MFGIIKDGTYRVEAIGFSEPALTSGYVVAVRPIKREADVPTTGTLFGRWTDADGTVYWDQVEVIDGMTDALDAARFRGELAVWDLANNVEVRVNPVDGLGDEHIIDQAAPDYTYCERATDLVGLVITVDGIDRDYTCTDCLVAFDERYGR